MGCAVRLEAATISHFPAIGRSGASYQPGDRGEYKEAAELLLFGYEATTSRTTGYGESTPNTGSFAIDGPLSPDFVCSTIGG